METKTKTYKFDFVAQVWMQCVEIEATSEEEAREKLARLDIYDMVVDHNGYQKDVTIDNDYLDVECEEDEDEPEIYEYEVLWYTDEENNNYETASFITEEEAIAFYQEHKTDSDKFNWWVTARDEDGSVLEDLVI